MKEPRAFTSDVLCALALPFPASISIASSNVLHVTTSEPFWEAKKDAPSQKILPSGPWYTRRALLLIALSLIALTPDKSLRLGNAFNWSPSVCGHPLTEYPMTDTPQLPKQIRQSLFGYLPIWKFLISGLVPVSWSLDLLLDFFRAHRRFLPSTLSFGLCYQAIMMLIRTIASRMAECNGDLYLPLNQGHGVPSLLEGEPQVAEVFNSTSIWSCRSVLKS